MSTSPLLGANALPTAVEIGGRAFPIRHDFTDGIRFEMLVCDKAVPESVKLALALQLWFLEMPDADLGDVLSAMLKFYRCGKDDNAEADSSEQLYSYAHDYDLIYAGFLSAYGIDLFTCGPLHWWRFKAMLSALPDSSQFIKVVGYRAVRITPDMPKEQRAFLTKMKRIYALPELADGRPVHLGSDEEYRRAIEAIREAKACMP
jgi:hypothetical protein